MVDFSVKSTGISAPDLGAATHITPGVEDRSAAMRTSTTTDLLKFGAEQGIEAYKGYQVSELNKDVQSTIQQYMDMRGNEEAAKSALTGAAATDVSTSLFKPQGEQLSTVEQAQRERLATYQQALAEGVMTPDEFNDRVLTNLREAVNKNPGLYQELKAEASRVLELSGITGIVKSDQLMAESKSKQAEKYVENLNSRLEKENIYYDHNWTVFDKEQALSKAEPATRAFKILQRNKEVQAIKSQEQARNFMDTSGWDVVRGGLQNANSSLISMIDTGGITTENYAKFKNQVDTTLDSLKVSFRSSIPASIMQDPNTQELIKSYDSGLEAIKTRLSNLTSGEDLKKVLTNEVEILKLGQESNLRKQVDVASIELSTKLAAAVPGIVTQSSEYRQKIYDAGIAISQGSFQSPALNTLVPKSKNDKVSYDLLKGSINLGSTSGDYTSFKRTLDAVNTKTTQIENPKTRLQFLYTNLSAIAEQKPMQLDVDNISKVETTISQILNDPNFGIGTLRETTVGKDVKIGALPSGHIVFTGKDASKFNSTYANNVNVALRAYANAHNTTMEKAAKRFYPQYLGLEFSPNTQGK